MPAQPGPPSPAFFVPVAAAPPPPSPSLASRLLTGLGTVLFATAVGAAAIVPHLVSGHPHRADVLAVERAGAPAGVLEPVVGNGGLATLRTGDALQVTEPDGTVLRVSVTSLRSTTRPVSPGGVPPRYGRFVVADVTLQCRVDGSSEHRGCAYSAGNFEVLTAGTDDFGEEYRTDSTAAEPALHKGRLAEGTAIRGNVVIDAPVRDGSLDFTRSGGEQIAGSWSI